VGGILTDKHFYILRRCCSGGARTALRLLPVAFPSGEVAVAELTAAVARHWSSNGGCGYCCSSLTAVALHSLLLLFTPHGSSRLDGVGNAAVDLTADGGKVVTAVETLLSSR